MLEHSKKIKIIIYLSILLVLYGVYYLHLEPTEGLVRKSSDGKETSEAVDRMGKMIRGSPSPEIIAYIESVTKTIGASTAFLYTDIGHRAEAEWSSDPFFKAKFYDALVSAGIQLGATSEEVRSKFVYSGYCLCGEIEMAIINDGEYMVGDIIEEYTGVYTVKAITSSSVVLENKVESSNLEILLTGVEN